MKNPIDVVFPLNFFPIVSVIITYPTAKYESKKIKNAAMIRKSVIMFQYIHHKNTRKAHPNHTKYNIFYLPIISDTKPEKRPKKAALVKMNDYPIAYIFYFSQ